MSAPASVVLVSAGAEWRAVKEILRPAQVTPSPLGEWFDASGARFFHGGWGKISAAASAQYVIDHFSPQILVNLGTCGGFDGRIQPGDLLLVEKTITYDIFEPMGDSAAAIEFYSTWLDLSWLRTLPATPALRRGLMVSADRDILPADIATLIEKYDARAADWESSAIAWVAVRNGVRVLILRGVTDLVSPHGGEAYGDLALFQTRTRHIMSTLLTWWKDWSGNLKG